MYICDHKPCKTMFHPACLVDHILTKEYPKHFSGDADKPAANIKKSKVKRKLYQGKMKGELVVDGEGPQMIKITVLKKGEEPRDILQRITCPKCDTLFEWSVSIFGVKTIDAGGMSYRWVSDISLDFYPRPRRDV